MAKKHLLRGSGISEEFAERFVNSKFYTDLYQSHKDEIILGVRGDYLNLYYNCDSIALLLSSPRELFC